MLLPQINWFDMSEMGIYLAPELICGKSCILLLDKKNIFTHKDILSGRLEKNGFLLVDFVSSEQSSVYVLFTKEIETDFFLKNLCMPKDQIYTFNASLREIQNIFYDQAENCFKKRIEVLIKSSLMLGYNSKSEAVHKSNFGRFKITKSNEGEKITTESIKESLVNFLRAKTLDDVFMCSREYIKNAVKYKKNISSLDINTFGQIIFEKEIGENIRPSQLFNILDCFNANYVLNFAELCLSKQKEILSDFRIYKKICLTYESSVSYPKGIQSLHLENSHTTPPPLALIMQRLLLNNLSIDHETKILNPMCGLGSLVSIISAMECVATGYEVNPKKIALLKKIEPVKIELIEQDFLSADTSEYGNEYFDYVISSPSFGHIDSSSEFKDSFGTLALNRMDLICLMKSLVLRKPKGRSVFLLKKGENDDFDSLVNTFNFINSRFVIDGIAVISKEIHSKSTLNIETLLIVISDKRVKHLANTPLTVEQILSTKINDYESLWDWSDFIIGKNNEKIKNIGFLLNNWQSLHSDTSYEDDYASVVSDAELIDPIGIGDESKKGFVALNHSNDIFSKFDYFDIGDTNTASIEPEAIESEKPSDKGLTDSLKDGLQKEDLTENTVKTEAVATNPEPTTSDANDHGEAETSSDTGEASDVNNESVSLAKPENEDLSVNSESAIPENSLTDAIDFFKNNNNIKIAKNYSDFFNLVKRSEIIRSHSLSAVSDTTTNVLLSDFSSYLKGKDYFNEILNSFFSEFALGDISEKVSDDFEYNLRVESNIEKFILSKINVIDQVNFPKKISSESVDLIASMIINESENKSVVFSNNNNLNAVRSLVVSTSHFFKQNKTMVFLAKSKKSIERFLNEINYVDSEILERKSNIGIIDSDILSPQELMNEINRGDKGFIIILNNKDIISSLRAKPVTDRFTKIKDTICILETDFTDDKYETKVFTHLLNGKVFFLSNNWINHKTSPQLLKSIFKNVDYSRYFSVNASSVTDMTAYLSKKHLIEKFQFFQLYEDYSDVKLSIKMQDNLGDNHEQIMGSYGNVLNKIAVLSEDIYRNLPQSYSVKNNNIYNFRLMILDIFRFIELCLSSVTLIYNTYTLSRENIKPIIVIPDNIEYILFNIFEKLNIFATFDGKDVPLVEVNQMIEHSIRNNESLGKIDDLIYIRNNSIIRYLMNYNKASTGLPNTIHLVSACLYFCLVDLELNHKDYDVINLKIKNIENEIENLLELPICYPDFIIQELSVNKVKCNEASSRLFRLEYNEQNGIWESKKNILSLSTKAISDDFNSGKSDAIIVEKKLLENMDLSSKESSLNTSDHLRKRTIVFTYADKSIDHYVSCIDAVHKKGQLSTPDVVIELPSTPVNQELVNLLKDQFKIFNINMQEDDNYKFSLSYFLNEKGNNLVSKYVSENPHFNVFLDQEVGVNIISLLTVSSLMNNESQLDFINQMYTLKANNERNEQETKTNPFNLIVVSPLVNKSSLTYDNSPYYLLRGSTENSSEVDYTSLEYIKETNNYYTPSRFSKEFEIAKKSELIDIKNTLNVAYQSLSISSNDMPEGLDKLYNNFYEILTNHAVKVFQDRIHNTLNNRYKKWIYKNNFSKMDQLKSCFVGNQGLKISNTLNNLYIECMMIGDQKLISDFEDSIGILTFISCYVLTLRDFPADKFISIPVPSPFNDRSDVKSQGALLQLIPPKNLGLALDRKSYLLKICYSNKSKPTYLTLDYVLKNSSVLKNKSILQEITASKEKLIMSVYKDGVSKSLISNKIRRLDFIGVSDFKTVTIESYFNIKNETSNLKKREITVLTNNIFLNYQILKEYCPLTLTSFNAENGITKYGLALPPEFDISEVLDILVNSCPVPDLEQIVDGLLGDESIRYLSHIELFGDYGCLRITGFAHQQLMLTFSGDYIQMEDLFLKSNLIANDSEQTITTSKKEFSIFKFEDFQDFSNNGKHIFKVGFNKADLKVLIKTIAKKELYRTAIVGCTQDSIKRKLEKITA